MTDVDLIVATFIGNYSAENLWTVFKKVLYNGKF